MRASDETRARAAETSQIRLVAGTRRLPISRLTASSKGALVFRRILVPTIFGTTAKPREINLFAIVGQPLEIILKQRTNGFMKKPKLI
jgi:hypothetical protein